MAGGESVDLGWPKQRALLAALLLTPNRVVSRADLTVALWGPNPPASATNGLQKYVSALRRALGPSRVLTRAPGYLIAVEPSELDLLEFEELAAAEKWADALALWRGEPCEDVELLGPWQAQLDALRERRDDLRGRLIDQRLAAGEHESLIPELKALVHADPLREQHWARLMRAQHRAGRTAQALATYADLRTLLADELGIDPGPELQRIHSALLTGNEPLAHEDDSPAVSTRWTPQSQLPLDVRDFVGREDAEQSIIATLTGDGTPVVVISGPPGAGKTALAVRLGHRVRTRFPDGQWFVRLNGASETPGDPAVLIGRLLQASGVDGAAIPDGLDARASTLRARLADRRVLLLLDDALDSDQVQQLLPGTSACAVIVTSRNTLDSLTVLAGAHRHAVNELSEIAAATLLRRTLHPEQIAAEPQLVPRLADLCGRLPLALRIAAANLAMHPRLRLSTYIDALNVGGVLTGLAVRGDERLAVRAAFGVSYRALAPEAQRAFRLLGLVPGADFTADAARSLLNLTMAKATDMLVLLFAASLLQEKEPGRFQFHDLLRLYATGLSDEIDGPAEQHKAQVRLFTWYLDMADAAASHLYPKMDRLSRVDIGDRQTVSFTSGANARRWMTSELNNLAAAIQQAARWDTPNLAWHLCDSARGGFWFNLNTDTWRASAAAGRDAARRLGAADAEAAMHSSLGDLGWSVGALEPAVGHYNEALKIYRRRGVTGPEATGTLNNLSVTYEHLGRLREAADVLDEALMINREAGHLSKASIQLSNLGSLYINLGRLTDAENCLHLSLEIDGGQDHLVAVCTHNLGEVHLQMGDYRLAEQYLLRALEIHTNLGNKHALSSARENLARLWLAVGRTDAAVEDASAALNLARKFGVPYFESDALNTLGYARQVDGLWSQAARLHDSALRAARVVRHPKSEISALLGIASCARGQGSVAYSIQVDNAAAAMAASYGFLLLEAKAIAGLAASHAAAGDLDTAGVWRERATALFRRTGQRHLSAELAKLTGAAPTFVAGKAASQASTTETADSHPIPSRSDRKAFR